jgi:thiamine transporter 2/3
MEWTADWRLRALLICAFGIIKEFRPATPFLTPFLENEPKNFTNVELYSQIFPFSTYSYLLSMASCFI